MTVRFENCVFPNPTFCSPYSWVLVSLLLIFLNAKQDIENDENLSSRVESIFSTKPIVT